jgi:hypothetical protein
LSVSAGARIFQITLTIAPRVAPMMLAQTSAATDGSRKQHHELKGLGQRAISAAAMSARNQP